MSKFSLFSYADKLKTECKCNGEPVEAEAACSVPTGLLLSQVVLLDDQTASCSVTAT